MTMTKFDACFTQKKQWIFAMQASDGPIIKNWSLENDGTRRYINNTNNVAQEMHV